jgi:DNA recombination protein RmuC
MTLAALALGLLLGACATLLFTRALRANTVKAALEVATRDLETREVALRASLDSMLSAAQASLTSARKDDQAASEHFLARGLDSMGRDLERLVERVSATDSERARTFGELSAALERAHSETAKLSATTSTLGRALTASASRGQWGEKMAADVLRAAGLVENINYVRQKGLEGTALRGEARSIPDFAVLLPGDLKLFLDSKFPLANYLASLDAEGPESERLKALFLKDVRARVRELAKRDYARGVESVDMVLLFIPNEAVHAVILESDPALIDEALASRVVLCSPLTLFAVLSVVRQAVDSFSLARTSSEVLELLHDFALQWRAFTRQFDKVTERLEATHKEWESLTGVRRRQLDRQLERVEDLRRTRSLGRQLELDGIE